MPKEQLSTAEITSSIIDNLGFNPTRDQQTVANHLGRFTLSTALNPAYILKGYAGTGKTSMISAFSHTLSRMGIYFVLLAPTGRAAKVLAGYTGFQAHTIHRYIYLFMTNADGVTSIVPAPNKLHNAIFIIDESSMIGNESQPGNDLFYHNNLLDDVISFVYSKPGNKLILVGDTAQLPPVGTNLSPALNIETLNAAYTITSYEYEMREVMRQSMDSGILSSATKIRNKIANNDTDFPYFNLDSPLGDVETIDDAETFGELLMDNFSGNEQENAIIVTRSNKQANIYNQQIRNRVLMRESEIEGGDLMMVIKNNYFWLEKDSRAGFIANGDIIKINRFRGIEEKWGFRFADVDIELIDYPDIKELNVKLLLHTINVNSAGLSHEDNQRLYNSAVHEYNHYPNRRTRAGKIKTDLYYNALHVKFSYAMTCHKTQGGQWNKVFVDKGFIKDNTPDKEYLRWLYTATTRATEKLYLIGFEKDYFKEK